MKTSLAKEKLQNGALAVGMGLLAAGVGLAVGSPTVNIAAVAAITASAYILADTRGWLLADTEETAPPDWRRFYAPFALYAVLVVLYMEAIDRDPGPPLAAMYLPVVLAVICYKVRVGLAVSAGVAALYLVQMTTRAGGANPNVSDIGAVISFPMTALFIAGLAHRLEARFRALHSKTNELSALLDMSQMMDSAPDLDTTLNLILLNFQQISNSQVCAVYLTSSDGKMLELRAASGPRHRLTLASSLAVSEAAAADWSLKDAAQREGEDFTFYTPDAQASSPAFSSRLFDLDHRAASFACLPLVSIDGLLGMLYLGYDAANGLATEPLQRMGPLAVRAAFSLQRAVLQQGFRSLAYSDAMTGLDNFRQFEQNLSDELRRAERYDRALSVILLDIDHFKTFNDTLGHQAGDALLAQLATILRDSLRSLDKPARYGGEEFVVVCPETGKDEVRLIAERIRRNVEQTAFALLGQDAPEAARTTHVTVSLGCATFPFDAATARDLVKSADQALYAAKHAGRNAVRSHDDLLTQSDKVAA